MKIELRTFSGIAPRYSAELLNEQNGRQAVNLSIKSGKIHPEKKFTIKAPDRDYVTGQVNDDQYKRLYFLDASGNLCVCGLFPNDTTKLTSRKVNISAPSQPKAISITSPFLDSIGGKMMLNYGTKSEMAEKAQHIYGIREIFPVEKEWIVKDNGNLERSYYYNPWTTEIFYGNPIIWNGQTVSAPVRSERYLEASKWSCTASLTSDGQELFSFVSRNTELDVNASVSGDLNDYNGNKIGSYSAHFEMAGISISLNDSQDPILNRDLSEVPDNWKIEGWDKTVGAYINDNVAYYDSRKGKYVFRKTADDSANGAKICGELNNETIPPCNLRFVINRTYTGIDRSAYYVVRAVNDIGEEGQPSEISALVTRKPDEKAVITFDPANTASSEHIAKYRLYRSAGGTKGSDFFFVDEISADGELKFHDFKTDDELNEVLPRYGEVPTELNGIVGMSGGFMAAYKGKDIFFSEPYMPYAFPWEYNQTVPFDIVGLAVRSNYLYVMTKGSLYAFVGDHPETILPLSFKFDVPCISRKSIAHVGGNIVYAGTTGLVLIGNGTATVFSDKLYTLEQYKDLHFENCISAGEYDGKYFAVFSDKVLLFDFADGDIKHTILDKNAFTAGTYSWNDGSWLNYEDNFVNTNTPYGETMITQDFSAANLTAVWQSKDFVSQRPIAFTSARVRFEDASKSVTMKLFAEDKEVFSGAVQHNKAFRLPVMRRECRWSVSVTGNTDITSIELAESMAEL
jgi:uncharacterized protein CbrC (UPF0167 family)